MKNSCTAAERCWIVRVSPHSQPLACPRSPFPLMPNKTKKERRRKVGFTPRLFFCLSKDLLFIVCDTESLCSPPPRRLWRRFFPQGGRRNMWLLWANGPAWVTLWRPAEDREMLHSFTLSLGSRVSLSQRGWLRLSLDRAGHRCSRAKCNRSRVSESHLTSPRCCHQCAHAWDRPGTNQQWSLVPQWQYVVRL